MSEQPTKETWFKTSKWADSPQSVQVEKSTDVSVWIDGNRRSRLSTYEAIFPSREQAWSWMIGYAMTERDNAQANLERRQARLDELLASRSKENV